MAYGPDILGGRCKSSSQVGSLSGCNEGSRFSYAALISVIVVTKLKKHSVFYADLSDASPTQSTYITTGASTKFHLYSNSDSSQRWLSLAYRYSFFHGLRKRHNIEGLKGGWGAATPRLRTGRGELRYRIMSSMSKAGLNTLGHVAERTSHTRMAYP